MQERLAGAVGRVGHLRGGDEEVRVEDDEVVQARDREGRGGGGVERADEVEGVVELDGRFKPVVGEDYLAIEVGAGGADVERLRWQRRAGGVSGDYPA